MEETKLDKERKEKKEKRKWEMQHRMEKLVNVLTNIDEKEVKCVDDWLKFLLSAYPDEMIKGTSSDNALSFFGSNYDGFVEDDIDVKDLITFEKFRDSFESGSRYPVPRVFRSLLQPSTSISDKEVRKTWTIVFF